MNLLDEIESLPTQECIKMIQTLYEVTLYDDLFHEKEMSPSELEGVLKEIKGGKDD